MKRTKMVTLLLEETRKANRAYEQMKGPDISAQLQAKIDEGQPEIMAGLLELHAESALGSKFPISLRPEVVKRESALPQRFGAVFEQELLKDGQLMRSWFSASSPDFRVGSLDARVDAIARRLRQG